MTMVVVLALTIFVVTAVASVALYAAPFAVDKASIVVLVTWTSRCLIVAIIHVHDCKRQSL